MKRLFCIIFILFVVFAVNGQTNKCTVKENIDVCKDTVVNKEDYYKLKDSTANLNKENEALLNSKASMQMRLNSLKVDEFLNIKDTSIFRSKFLILDETSIPARDREYYKLIKYIHDLNFVLNQKSEGSYSELLKMARENSDKASDIIKAIITSVREEVFSWLSESQVEYYRQLIKQYNELVESLN